MKYELLKFSSSNDEYFYDALKIYQQSIPHEQKTNSSEIVYWVDNLNTFKEGELFFFGLSLNNKTIGYAEIAFIKNSRILIIDYIALDPVYKSNSAFYSFYSLIIKYFDSRSLDYDFITKEILCRYNETHIHKEDICQYELENFKVINCLYIQPQLEEKNIESNKEALLMIYQRATTNSKLKKEAYLNIVSTIYKNYYYHWDLPFTPKDEDRHKLLSRAEKNIESISKSIKKDLIPLNGYPFRSTSSSDHAVIPEENNRKNFKIAIICTCIIVALVVGILAVLRILDFDTKSIVIVGTSVVFVVIVFAVLLNEKTLETIKKIPVISKLFELLK
ncbi:hypothetical protein LJB95_02960 [Paludibacteraceae bacterium OttesenSCG-928-F17]|nr:hypothetical protein [Paludibacteraceae bacterium OttesenSCG-928-F17]